MAPCRTLLPLSRLAGGRRRSAGNTAAQLGDYYCCLPFTFATAQPPAFSWTCSSPAWTLYYMRRTYPHRRRYYPHTTPPHLHTSHTIPHTRTLLHCLHTAPRQEGRDRRDAYSYTTLLPHPPLLPGFHPDLDPEKDCLSSVNALMALPWTEHAHTDQIAEMIRRSLGRTMGCSICSFPCDCSAAPAPLGAFSPATPPLPPSPSLPPRLFHRAHCTAAYRAWRRNRCLMLAHRTRCLPSRLPLLAPDAGVRHFFWLWTAPRTRVSDTRHLASRLCGEGRAVGFRHFARCHSPLSNLLGSGVPASHYAGSFAHGRHCSCRFIAVVFVAL